ncbi:MAG TPA: CDP-alcohol phosphatidyltransferase family protein [Jatrophihabitans sp.]|jgi:phosphatidylglycerophosphate synthase|nr:CDP-alcohol phosphatidyltransferase family protein [Jatrophihabitans sp.]
MTTPAQRWSALHHGIDPARVPLLSGWLRLMWLLAGPLARRRVPPILLTALGAVFALDAVLLAGSVPWAAAIAVLAAVTCDGVDGAIAVLGDRASRGGALADAATDRLADLAFAAVLWRCGAPWWSAVVAGGLAVSVDAGRRMRGVPSRLTVAERPTWTICAVLACASAAATRAQWPVDVCVGVWIAAGAVGVVQVAR